MRIWSRALSLVCGSALSGVAAAAPTVHWVGTWAAAPMACPVKSGESAADSTYRNVMRIGVGGRRIRVQLTNEFGSSPLKVDSAHIAVDSGDGAIEAGTDHPLTFGGHSSFVIPAGAFLVSDEVPMDLRALAKVSISVHVADQEIATKSCHVLASTTNYVVKGDATNARKMNNARSADSWSFVKGIEVGAERNSFSIVALGDSITDGAASTPNANHRWPDFLQERLLDKKVAAAVLNEGIIGNRVLRTEWGQNSLARFDRDVLAQSGARYLIILEGINDINWSTPEEEASADELIAGISQLVARAHAHGIAVIAATLTPCADSDGFSDKKEQIRTAINRWYHTPGLVDGVVDFDAAVRDPSKPSVLNPAYDSGDHLHPNDTGYAAMAKAIDLSLFR